MFCKKKYHLFYKIAIPVIVIITGIAFFSCTKDVGKIMTTCSLPETVSFNKDVAPIFKSNCALAGCHVGANPTGNLNLEEANVYNNLMKKGSGYIDTINPNYSLLYSQMISTSNPMPPSGNLDACKTSLILKWIGQKARNN
jgi:hypothetical protein